MPDETKMRKCRACGKDTKVGEACESCGWDEEEERSEVMRNRLHKQIEKEMDDADAAKNKGEKKKKKPFRLGL